MKEEIKIPKMGESIVDVTIGAILKKSGSSVKEGDEIIEIETEKVNQVLNAPVSGKVEWSVKEGDSAKIDQVIGSIDQEAKGEESEAPKEAPKEEKAQEERPQENKPSSEPFQVRKKTEDFVKEVQKEPSEQKESSKEKPIREPVQSVSSKEKKKERVGERETRSKMSKMRKVIAQRLVQVKNETAMLTTFNEVDMSAIIDMRKEFGEAFEKKYGVRLGFMSFFVKACVSALQAFPDVNARIEKDEIVYQHFYNIGIAVGSDKGLFVPVLKDADRLSSDEIEKALKMYAEKARSQRITVDEMQGGTFTISNGGVYGSMLSTPILNPPQSAILGMHNIVKRAVVIDDEIVIRPMMYLALSYDHRIIDGKESIGFLMHIKKRLEEPQRFLLDV